MLAGYVEAPFSKGWRPTHFSFMKKKPTSRFFARNIVFFFKKAFTGHLRVTASEAGVTWIFLLLLKPIVYSCFLISKPHKYYIYFIWFKRSCSFNTKLNDYLYGIVKTRFIIIYNVNVLLYMPDLIMWGWKLFQLYSSYFSIIFGESA